MRHAKILEGLNIIGSISLQKHLIIIIPTETRSKTNVKYTAKHVENLSQKQCKKLRSSSKMLKSTDTKTLENSAAS